MSRNYICVFSTALKHRVRESKKAFWSTKKLKMDLIEESKDKNLEITKTLNPLFMNCNFVLSMRFLCSQILRTFFLFVKSELIFILSYS